MARPKKPKAEVIEAELVDEVALELASPASSVQPYRVDLLRSFLSGKHAQSVKAYRHDLSDFASWALTGESGLPAKDKPTDKEVSEVMDHFVQQSRAAANSAVLEFRSHLIERGLAPNTINRKIAAVRSIVKMARIIGACSWEIEITGVAVENVRDVEGCGPEGYAKLLEVADALVVSAQSELEELIAAGESTKGTRAVRDLTVALRDKALLSLYHDAGLRRSEPLGMHYPRDCHVGCPKPRIRFRGKKRRVEQWHAINRRCERAIMDWLDVRGESDGPLFISTHPSHWGKPLRPRTINKRIEKLAELADVDVTPHGLRHTAATTLLDKTNGNVRAVAEFLRHKGTGIVQAYDDRRKELAREMGSLLDED